MSFDPSLLPLTRFRVAQVGEGQLDWGSLPRPDRLPGPSQDDARQDTIVHRGRHGGLGLGRVGKSCLNALLLRWISVQGHPGC